MEHLVRASWRAALASACLIACLAAAADAQALAPQKQTAAFPVALPRTSATPAPSLACVVTFGPPTAISAVAFSPDGQALAAGGYQEVLMWDLKEAKLSKRIGAGLLSGPVRALAFLDSGKSLAVGFGLPGQSGGVRVFDVATGALTAAFAEPKDVVYSLAASPEGTFLAAGAAGSAVYVWDLRTKLLATALKDHVDWVAGVAFSPDGKLLATASADKTMQVWEVEGWKKVASRREPEALSAVAFGPDGTTLAAAVGGTTERVIRTGRKEDARWYRAMTTGDGIPLGMVWNAKANRIYAACSDKTVRVFQGNGTTGPILRGHTDWVYGVAASTDGARVASGSGDGTVRLWNGADGKPLATLVQLAPGADPWIIVTEPGFVAASSADAFRWEAKGLQASGADLTATLQNVDSVRKVLAGQAVAAPALK